MNDEHTIGQTGDDHDQIGYDTTGDEKQADATLAVVPPEKVRVRRVIREKVFQNSLVVRRMNGDKIMVPIESRDNKKANMVLVSMAREMVKEQMDLYRKSGEILKPKEMAEVASAAKTVIDMADKVYAESEEQAGGAGRGGADSSALSAGLQAVGKGMMEGGLSAVMKELDALGKKKAAEGVKVEKPIDI